MLPKKISEYFSFTNKEKKAYAILIIILTVLLIFNFNLELFHQRDKVDNAKFQQVVAALDRMKQEMPSEVSSEEGTVTDAVQAKAPTELFFFDPNTASVIEFEKLGLSPRVARTIEHFRSKGGKFYRRDDIRKIYGLQEQDATRLIPYIRLPKESRVGVRTQLDKSDLEAKEFVTSIKEININRADTTLLKSLPGIGSKLAARIIKFRDALGGFYSLQQLKAVYRLPDSTFQQIRSMFVLDEKDISKININNAGIDELRRHPYLSFKLAKTINAYRKEHGDFTDIAQLRNILSMPDTTYQKLIPYLSVK